MAPTTTNASSSTASQTIDSLKNSIVERSKETDNAPKLKSNTVEEYLRWKRYIKWWKSTTKMPKSRMTTHIIMHCINDGTVSEKLLDMDDDGLTNDEGLKKIMEVMDAHFLTNHESKLFNTWTLPRKTEKKSDMSCDIYIKKVNQIVKELERQGLKLGDKANAVALISASNLDSNSRLHIESVARNLNNNQGLSAKYIE